MKTLTKNSTKTASKSITIHTRSQVELLKHTPSALFRAARYRSGAGIHADNVGRYGKRERAMNRQEERRARLGHGDTD